jgi:hypothetical protein
MDHGGKMVYESSVIDVPIHLFAISVDCRTPGLCDPEHDRSFPLGDYLSDICS